MIVENKINTDEWYPVILKSSLDFKENKTGITYDLLTVTYYAAGATSLSTYSVTVNDWIEAGNGRYSIRIGGGEFTSPQRYQITISATDCVDYDVPIEALTYKKEEINAMINSIISETQSHPTLAEMEASTVIAKQATVAAIPSLAQIEASTILAKVNSPMDLKTGLNQTALNEIADSTLLRDWTQILATVPQRCALQALRFLRNSWSVAAGKLTINKEDGITPAWEKNITSNANANPVTGVDNG
jgi:hypothetical protein